MTRSSRATLAGGPSVSFSPWSSTTTRCESGITTSITCSTTQMARPISPWMRRTSSTAAVVSNGVSPDMASSSSRRRGLVASARVISSRFLSARVRAAAITSSLPASPVKASSSSARARAGPIRLVRRKAPQITFSSTVMRPKLRTTCQVRAMPRRQIRSGRAREMSVPSSTIRPSSG